MKHNQFTIDLCTDGACFYPSYSADTFVVNQTLVLRINICGKIATFAKPQIVMGKFKKRRAAKA
ncbi:MAG: hypothetical protein ACI86C_001865 [Candidatus Latescibacterota bacterium]|jgi:hypothetical protein